MYDIQSYEIIQPCENKIGIIAHELQQKFPDIPHLVENNKDEVDETGKFKLQTIDEKELLMLSIKAIQELRAENEELKRRVEELFTIVQSLINR